MLSDRLQGKVAIVTDTGGGIGRGCALMFARHGAKVMGCDLHPADAEQTVAMAHDEGLVMASLHPCNLINPLDVDTLIDHTIKTYGAIDILVNAAAFGAFEYIEAMDYQRQWKRTLEGELDIVFLACKAVWPHMKQRGGGSIINFASVSAYTAHPALGAIAHCAGKGGVLAMTRQLAAEGGPYGIRANAIAPGLIITKATLPEFERPGFETAVLGSKMIKRLGQPEDIAWCATFLASDESSWVTGTDFSVDGGASGWIVGGH